MSEERDYGKIIDSLSTENAALREVEKALAETLTEYSNALKALQTAVAEHLVMMHCYLPNAKHYIYDKPTIEPRYPQEAVLRGGIVHIDDGTGHCIERHWTPEEQKWINENDSGSLHDALGASGFPVRDQYGNLDLPRMGR